MYLTILFDIDGTLVDSNDAHADAWVKAFSDASITVDPVKVRRCIGMGGDKLMPAVSGIEEESPPGERISSRRREIFTHDHLPRLQPFPDAQRLVATLKERGFTLVAASSAKRDELRALLKLAGVDGLLDSSTSSDDAEESKPDPDIIHAALKRARASASDALMIGDTPYDIAAATRAGVGTIAFRCAGGAMRICKARWPFMMVPGISFARWTTPCSLSRRHNDVLESDVHLYTADVAQG